MPKYIPLIIITFTLLATFLFGQILLSTNAKHFSNDFKEQYLSLLSTADLSPLINKLNIISGSVNLSCTKIKRGQNQIYYKINGPCGNGFDRREEILKYKDITLKMTIKLPSSTELMFIILLLFQLLVLTLMFIMTKASLRQEIFYAEKLRDFYQQIAHDIKGPLQVLNNLIIEENPKTIILRLLNTVDNVLHSSNSNLAKAVEDLKKEFNFTLKIHDSPYKDINISQFKRVISNLIKNSIEANGNVTIEIFSDRIIVSDDGIGIAPDVINNIFNKNFTTKDDGNGIGLYFIQSTLKKWNWQIKVSSQIGLGTKFELIYPVTKLILIDDDPIIRMMWEDKFKDRITTYENSLTLIKDLRHINEKDIAIYIDSDLGNEKGEDIAKKLYKKGFKNIYIETGFDPDNFKHLKFLKGVIGKTPPNY